MGVLHENQVSCQNRSPSGIDGSDEQRSCWREIDGLGEVHVHDHIEHLEQNEQQLGEPDMQWSGVDNDELWW